MNWAEADIRALARRLSSLASTELRAAYLRHRLLRMSSAAVAELIILAVSGAEARDPELSDLLQSLSLALADPSCKATRAAAARHLIACDQQALAAFIWEAATLPSGDSTGGQGRRVPDFGRNRPVTLGERKSLARCRDRDMLSRLAKDPHPDVIRILLGNPILTEAEVLRLSARRPAPPAVLREVFQSPRWIVRYTIKAALALNPYAPLDVRLQLTPFLTRKDIHRILAGGPLHPILEQACRRMVHCDTIH